MNEKLIKDYWLAIGNNVFPDFEVEIVCEGNTIIFRECAIGPYGFEQHTIELLDIVAWVYSKM